MNLNEEQRQKIKNVGERLRLKLLLLHGSYGAGRAKPESDLDIAFLSKGTPDGKIFSELFHALGEIFGNDQNRELDIASLHRADPLFRYEVAKNSRLLYGDVRDFDDFKRHAFVQYQDSRDLRKLERFLIDKYQTQLNKTILSRR